MKLKPCPFCGGEASIGQDMSDSKVAIHYFVNCIDCSASLNTMLPCGETREDAILLWNKRV